MNGDRCAALSKTSAERLWVKLMQNCGMVEEVSEAHYRPCDIGSRCRAIITPHALRHNYATMCWEAGLDAYTTMRLMGHASIKTTMDIYTHLNDVQLDRVSEKAETIFKTKKLHKSCTNQGNG